MIKLFRSCVGRPTVTYLEHLPNFGQLTTVKLLLDTVENRYKKNVNVHGEIWLKFESIGIKPWWNLLDYECILNSNSKSCPFQNYDRDATHLEMILIAAPQKIKENLLFTPDLNLEIARDILKTIEIGLQWVSQANSIKLDNGDVKIKQEVNFKPCKKSTFEAVGRKHYSCSRCGKKKKHARNDKSCPSLKTK